MINWTQVIFSLLAGSLLGVVYFGGLWWTVNCLGREQAGLPFYFLSLLVRLAVLFTCLYLVMQTGITNLLLVVAGLVMVRMLFVGRLGMARLSTPERPV